MLAKPARFSRRRRLMMPPRMTTLVAQAVALGYELPDTEYGDVTDAQGRVFPAMKVTLDGNERLPAIESVCRIVPGPESLDERVGWAARSALAEALRLAVAEQARRAAVEDAES